MLVIIHWRRRQQQQQTLAQDQLVSVELSSRQRSQRAHSFGPARVGRRLKGTLRWAAPRASGESMNPNCVAVNFFAQFQLGASAVGLEASESAGWRHLSAQVTFRRKVLVSLWL